MYKELPDIEIKIIKSATETFTFVIDKEEYMVPTDKSTVYLFGVQPMDFEASGASTDDGNYWIVGLLLLKKYYTVYDFENERVGIVEAAPSGGPINLLFLSKYILLLSFFSLIFSGCCFGFCCCCKPCKIYRKHQAQKKKDRVW